MKHTPGPWKVSSVEEDVIEGGRAGIFYIAQTFAGLPGEETQANARLIAAAPELLKVCENVFVHLTTGFASTRPRVEADEDMAEIVQAAIAKATEKEPA